MVVIHVDNNTFEISTIKAEYSPYIYAALDFSRKSGGSYNEIVLEDIDPRLFSNYFKFLSGVEFRMEKRDEEFFAFMGHPNIYEYPLSYWRFKLEVIWARDNVKKFNIDPYRYLIPINAIRDADMGYNNYYIIGSVPLYLAGISNIIDADDAVIYTTNDLNDTRGNPISRNKLGVISTDYNITRINVVHTTHMNIEDVFDRSIDIDQVMLVSVGKVAYIYATRLAKYIIETGAFYINPYSSIKDIESLGRYKNLDILIPGMKRCNLDTEFFESYDNGRYRGINTRIIIDNIQSIVDDWSIDIRMSTEFLQRNIGLPTDPGSVIIMISYLNMRSSILINILLENYKGNNPLIDLQSVLRDSILYKSCRRK